MPFEPFDIEREEPVHEELILHEPEKEIPEKVAEEKPKPTKCLGGPELIPLNQSVHISTN